MDPREPLEILPMLSRVRDSFPVVSAIMPGNKRDLRVFEIIALTLVSTILANLFRLAPGQPIRPLAVVCAIFTLGGMRRGQDTYVGEAGRCVGLSMLAGAEPDEAYLRATSHGVRRQALLLAPIFAAVTMAVHLLSGAGPAECLAIALPVTWLPSVTLLLRELVAHGAVLAQNIAIPQYLYLGAGAFVGIGLHAAGARALDGADPVHPARFSIIGIAASIAGLAVWISLDQVVKQARRVPMVDVTGIAVPRRAARIPMPLAVFLWRARGRRRSSVIIGFAAILTMLGFSFASIVRGLPSFGNAYARPELAMVVIYGFAYLTATLVELPLDLRGAGERTLLIRLVNTSGAREILHIVGWVLFPTLACSFLVAALSIRYTAFPSNSALLVYTCAAMLAVAATNVVAIPELTKVKAWGAGLADEFPGAEVVKSAFVALLASMAIIGSGASSPHEGGRIAVAVAVAVAVSVASGVRLRSVILRFN